MNYTGNTATQKMPGAFTITPVAPRRSRTNVILSKTGKKLHSEGRNLEALEILERHIATGTADLRLIFQAARYSWYLHDSAKAKHYLDMALERDPEDTFSLQFMGDLKLADGEIDLAAKFYIAAARRNPDNPQYALTKLTHLYRKSSQTDKALRVIGHLTLLRPADSYVLNEAILLYRAVGEHTRANKLILDAADKFPDDPIYMLLRGRMAIEHNDAEGVQKCIGKLLGGERVHPTSIFFARAAAIMGYFERSHYDVVLQMAKAAKIIMPPYDDFEWPLEDAAGNIAARNFLKDMDCTIGNYKRSQVFNTQHFVTPMDRTAWNVSDYDHKKKAGKVVTSAQDYDAAMNALERSLDIAA